MASLLAHDNFWCFSAFNKVLQQHNHRTLCDMITLHFYPCNGPKTRWCKISHAQRLLTITIFHPASPFHTEEPHRLKNTIPIKKNFCKQLHDLLYQSCDAYTGNSMLLLPNLLQSWQVIFFFMLNNHQNQRTLSALGADTSRLIVESMTDTGSSKC